MVQKIAIHVHVWVCVHVKGKGGYTAQQLLFSLMILD